MKKNFDKYVIFVILLLASIGSSQRAEDQNTGDILLPKDLDPMHYLIRVRPYINGNFTFEGYLELTFFVLSTTNRIVLHIKDIITKNETVLVSSQSLQEDIQISSQKYDDERQFYIATLAISLKTGQEYTISMHYQGYLNDQLKGFYRSSYLDENGNTRLLAATQFAAIDARRAFPCFDEPAFKAEFSIEVIREESMNSVSNMPKQSSTPLESQPGWVLDVFETSHPMSTYLVAFIVSDFESMSSDRSNSFRVLARKNALQQANYALEIGEKILDFYEGFFEVPYPLPKLDMAAVPDFPFNGMENWGLITYKENAFLYDELQTSSSAKRKLSLVVSHELAHMWFGNLVTPTWWTDIWLNEGFATYIQYLGMNAVDPSQEFLGQILILSVHEAFSLDCLESSHPISIPVHHPDQINEIFDSITYQKGASILRMMSHFLSEETFRSALNTYLTDLSYDNAEQDDLWQYMTGQAHNDSTLPPTMRVKEIMDTWTLQMGFPVLTITRDSSGILRLEQERFLLYKDQNSKMTHDYKWWIPITYTSSSNPDFDQTTPKEWMMPSEAEKTLQEVTSEDDWIIFNIQCVGYFRVNYDEQNWRALANQLNNRNQVIHSVNRAQLIDDALNLARAGYLSYDIGFEVLSYLRNEQEYIPLSSALRNINFLNQMFANMDDFTLLQNFFLDLLMPIYETVGFSDTRQRNELDKLKRNELVQMICQFGEESCIQNSINLFNQWMANANNSGTTIVPDLKSTVYCTAIREGGSTEWDFAFSMYLASNVGTEKHLLLQSLACSRDKETLRGYLERSIDVDGDIRKQDVKTIFDAVSRNQAGRDVAWDFVRQNWIQITDYFGSSLFTLTAIVESTTQYLNTQQDLQDLQAFKETYKGKFLSAARAVNQAEENVKANVEWMQKNYAHIVSWLNEKNYEGMSSQDQEIESASSAQGKGDNLAFLFLIFCVIGNVFDLARL